MISSLRRFFSIRHTYENSAIRQRAQGLLIMIWTAIVGLRSLSA